MHDANEMECLIFLNCYQKYCFRKSNEKWDFRGKQKINYHYFPKVGSYKHQPLMNRVNGATTSSSTAALVMFSLVMAIYVHFTHLIQYFFIIYY